MGLVAARQSESRASVREGQSGAWRMWRRRMQCEDTVFSGGLGSAAAVSDPKGTWGLISNFLKNEATWSGSRLGAASIGLAAKLDVH